jgi:hypothetical protein
VSKRLSKDATSIDVSITCSALVDKEKKVYAITTTERALQIKDEISDAKE